MKKTDLVHYLLTQVKQDGLNKEEAISLVKKLRGSADRSASNAIPPMLHPLVHRNTSDSSGQRFSSTFKGEEFFLRDHVVQGQRVLPGVAHLEMARAAVAQATHFGGVALEGVVFVRPLAVDDEGRAVHIALMPRDGGEIDYEIYTRADAGAPALVHSQGRAVPHEPSEPEVLDLNALRARCQDKSVDGAQCYAVFDALGLNYGERFRAVESLGIGRDDQGQLQVLAKLALPSGASAEPFVLHPSMMDAALQAALGLSLGEPSGASFAGGKASLPYALERLRVFGASPAHAWAWVRYSAGCTAQSPVRKLDIDLVDEQGRVCVRLEGFSSRMIESEPFSDFEQERSRAEVVPESSIDQAPAPTGLQQTDSNDLTEKTGHYLKRLLSSTLKLSADRIDVDAPMEQYGIDSILVLQLTTDLEKRFGPLSKTLFFEYQTLRALTDYFVQSHSDRLIELLGIEKRVQVAQPTLQAPAAPARTAAQTRDTRLVPTAAKQGATAPQRDMDIAIIGLSGRYPEARNLDAFWSNLSEGKDCIREIPAERWNHDLYFDADKEKRGKSYSKWGGFIEGVDEFDPLFFNISPREAELMDPQERLFLQCVYETLEDAGYTRERLRQYDAQGSDGNVGVFVGVMYEEYQLYGAQEQARGRGLAIPGNASSVANRVSYFCNFHGPSLAVNTMCSSSLTALHLACQSLQRGGCELAVAGGVNVSVHPNKYLLLSGGKFTSSKGRCESFGEGGDGYVPGEGVGAVLLKPLAKAIADGDHIHGVIKGTAINHGGKTNGYSVPNPNAQASVIGRALKGAGVHPRTISYIEAHGTGTSLGDPIEITGLSKAFGNISDAGQYCSIGSAKSNIGHCESAAGIAGITKVLLQMKHKTLVPSLHSQTLNPNIDFKKTPFVVQQALGEWKRPVVSIDGGPAREYPRIAGVSSFGAGGSNAHVILEEYIPGEEARVGAPVSSARPAVIVLSAKNEERLKDQVRQLLEAVKSGKLTDSDLPDVAYTLQVGREAMESRVGLLVDSVDALGNKLQAILNGQDIDDVYTGQAKRNKEALGLFAGDEDFQQAIASWVAKGKYGKLLELWAKGMTIDWDALYADAKPRRVSLPTYPFAKERYWIPVTKEQAAIGGAQLHPLLHQNTSDFSEQRFTSTFAGDEFFLRDHVVQGQRVLPGVAHLEMARAAIEKTTGAAAIRLEQVAFVRPLAVREVGAEVHVALMPRDDGDIEYQIYTLADSDAEPTVHSQGYAVLNEAARAEPIDLAALREQCQDRQIAGAQCYAAFEALGLRYGSSFRAIESLALGQLHQGQHQVLAKLTMPAGLSVEPFVLHPSVMDAALQASMGLSIGDSGGKASLPFAIGEVSVFRSCASQAWAWVRYSAGSTAQSPVRKLDIDVVDEDGRVCVQLRDFSLRTVDAAAAATPSGIGTLLLKPEWRAQQVEAAAPRVYTQRRVVLAREFADFAGALKARLPQAEFEVLRGEGPLAVRYESATTQMLASLQSMLQARAAGDALLQVVIADEGEAQLLAGLSGLLKTARQENPRLIGQLIGVAKHASAEQVAAALAENAASPHDARVRYVEGQRQAVSLAKLSAGPVGNANSLPWRDAGVYLITGGAGGLGLLFAREIAQRAEAPVLVLSGRSPLDDRKQSQLEQLRALGATVAYRQADIADALSVQGLVDGIVDEFGALHGIVHSAGVIADNFLLKKTPVEMAAVLAPKVSGLVALDEATKSLALDWLVLFSSLAGALGNVGQGDYAAANAFMDSHAAYRNHLVAAGQRNGHTVSLNWPLWADGGMHVDAAVRARIEASGFHALETASGIQAFYDAFASGQSQVVVLSGVVKRLESMFLPASDVVSATEPSPPNETSSATTDAADLTEKTAQYLKRLLSSTLKLSADRIDGDAPLEQYGIDSVLVLQLTSELEKHFGSLSKTLFFEYQTLGALAEYFVQSHRDRLIALLGTGTSGETARPAPAPTPTRAMPALSDGRARASRFAPRGAKREQATPVSNDMDIAIIGISGRYPEARNLDAFWTNLSEGKDCIREIPAERWDHGLYFDADKEKLGKSYSKWGGFIEGVDEFDPLFFNISPREAELMDPQERLFLQCVYETLEDAGYTRERLRQYQGSGLEGNVGVFVGVMYEEYQLYGAQEQARGRGLAIPGNASSVANRVSYFCNFHGPSIAIDTMCSSSLTALHLACLSLQRGGCELAVAGGVNVSVHPNKYLLLSGGKFTSSKGRCESFGEGGDGYVPGEGVGAVLLKPLAKAIADGDHIHGVIKGTAINHGGKTNGYSVPNPNAQASVISHALKSAGVHPRTISYIEAHGTGTSLGDPIEITGLSKAFGQPGDAGQYCAIGSAKSNIGHCESAAGIAGITKVLLQMKYKKLVPSLHSQTLNPNIDFKKTPFVVQQALGEWKRPVVSIDGGPAREYPRIAGVSSFGAGGSNAHVILEEYIPGEEARVVAPVSSARPAVIVLSAKNDERLKDQVRQLLEAVKSGKLTDSDLPDVAYTLQVGREAMESRVGLLVDSVDALGNKLQAILNGQDIDDVYTGQAKRNKEALGLFAGDEDLQQAIASWIAKGKYGKLLELWVKGLVFDWNKLYGDVKPRRISLPTYPFAKDRYWVQVTKEHTATSTAVLHPLVHQNTSTFNEQRFSSTFKGDEFFLRDHVVQGQRVLPGVAHLEMARAAVAQAADIVQDEAPCIVLKQVVFARPLAVGESGQAVHIALTPQDGGEIDYEIYAQADRHADRAVYSQGQAILSVVELPEPVQLEVLRSQCQDKRVDGAQCYAVFDALGLQYGTGFRGLEALHLGRDSQGQPQVLAKLAMPAGVSAQPFVLHPSIMDAALQASMGLSLGESDGKASLPFGLERLQVLTACPSQGWAWVRYSAGSSAQSPVRKLDIDVMDEYGRVCVRLEGFSLRMIDGGGATENADLGTLLLKPEWRAQAVQNEPPRSYAQRWVVLGEELAALAGEVEAQLPQAQCEVLRGEGGIAARYESATTQVLALLQVVLQARPTGDVLMQVVIADEGEAQLLAGLAGLLKTARQENPKLIGQVISLSKQASGEQVVAALQENAASVQDVRVRYVQGQRQVVELTEMAIAQSAQLPWRDAGVYLITGGAGGLGLLFAREIAQRTEASVLILSGRSPLDERKQSQLDQLRALGATVVYRQADIADALVVQGLVEGIVDEFGALHGIVHSAGVIQDNVLLRKTTAELKAVLAPKVSGLTALDEATKAIPLDWLMLFSSVAGAFGNVGQADYAAANGFMDSFAAYRNGLVEAGQRHGHTISLNWPLWAEGGMHVDAAVQERLRTRGMHALETAAGIQALYDALAGGQSQVVVLAGAVKRLQSMFLRPQKAASALPAPASVPTPQPHALAQASTEAGTQAPTQAPAEAAIRPASSSSNDLLEKVQASLMQIVSAMLKVEVAHLELDAELNEYGIDSIGFTQLNNQLNRAYRLSLEPTVFFEYTTLGSMADYLVRSHGAAMAAVLAPGLASVQSAPVANAGPVSRPAPASAPSVVPAQPATFSRRQRFTLDLSAKGPAQPAVREPEAIAIIGMSGRYPEARDLDVFWSNLRAGKDCIREVPADRWDHDLYFDPDKDKPGKSYSKWGGFIEGVDEFDPQFFNISRQEAELMDPQARVFLETIWNLLEDTGHTREVLQERYRRKVGLYVGAMYQKHQSQSSIANKASYLFGLQGPSIAVDTMSSSSMVAIHMACKDLLLGECELAIAGGVSLPVDAKKFVGLSQAQLIGSHPDSRSFADADGLLPAEGAGAVLLKPLSRAVADGDRILAVIKSSATNHSGRSSGYAVPNLNAQADLIEHTLTKAKIDPRTISYVEAAANGSLLGDPIEVAALNKAFRKFTGDQQFCAIGSVKSNMGHAEAASGVSQLAKVVLQLRHKQLVPSIKAEKLNPNLSFEGTPFRLQQSLQDWPQPVVEIDGERREVPRRAMINSFGAGGSYANLIVEEYVAESVPPQASGSTDDGPVAVVLSAKTQDRLRALVQRMLERVQADAGICLSDLAYTLQTAREAMDVRVAWVVQNRDELVQAMTQYLALPEEGGEEAGNGGFSTDAKEQSKIRMLLSGRTGETLVQTLLAERDLEKLALLWTQGAKIAWQALYEGQQARRISLPTYPFAKIRFPAAKELAHVN